MRVLSVNTERGWRGGENQVLLLARGLARAGVAHAVACRAGQPLAERLAALGLEHRPFAVGGSFAPSAIRALCRLVEQGGFDLLHAHASQAHGLALAAARLTGRPLVVTRRVDFPVGKGLVGRLKYGHRVARFVAISQAIAAILRRDGVPPERIRVIPSGIDPERFAAVPALDLAQAFALPAGCRVWVCVAALVAHKGHRHLLDAWAQVEAASADAALVLVGDGELRAALTAQAQALGLHRLRFAGERRDVPAILRGAQGFVMASVEEGLGTSLMDACCCGLPVVATRAGGIPELIGDGREGLLVEPGCAGPLAAALLRVQDDAVLAQGLAAAAAARSADFHYRHMVAAYRRLYQEVLRP